MRGVAPKALTATSTANTQACTHARLPWLLELGTSVGPGHGSWVDR